MTITGHYQGSLRCSLRHEKSGTHIQTDAPTDNNGKGELFSPTDLVAAALASCMLTIIGIRAQKKQIEIGNPSFSVNKVMDVTPRKIGRLEIIISFNTPISEEDRSYLENEALNCPVALSLSSELRQEVRFIYN
jgi:uncharacterized OsmC-like protein